jgi:FkbM family methyltransferase
MKDGKTVICEVGVGPLGMAYSALVWSNPNVHVLAFEPHPTYYAEVLAAAAGRSNVELHNVAIGDESGTLELYDEGTSSALAGVGSPSLQHHGVKPRTAHKVEVRRISDYDQGQIDILRIDTEGAEWFCLKHLVSRPEQIVVEIYNDLATYINPHLWEIAQWAVQNGYKLTDINDGDFIYER